MKNKKANKDIFYNHNKYGLIIFLFIFGIIIFSNLFLFKQGEAGQITKFIIYDVIMSNIMGVIFILLIIFMVYIMIFYKSKSQNPLKLIIYCCISIIFFVILSFIFFKGGLQEEKDVINYFKGNIIEENVKIIDFEKSSSRTSYLYTYVFSDGRIFKENHDGKNFDNIKLDSNYRIRYLPLTKKILSIQPI